MTCASPVRSFVSRPRRLQLSWKSEACSGKYSYHNPALERGPNGILFESYRRFKVLRFSCLQRSPDSRRCKLCDLGGSRATRNSRARLLQRRRSNSWRILRARIIPSRNFKFDKLLGVLRSGKTTIRRPRQFNHEFD